MGIDVGTTAISAALFDSQTQRLYPLTWRRTDQAEPVSLSQVPAVAYLPAELLSGAPVVPTRVGQWALEQIEEHLTHSLSSPAAGPAAGMTLANFKHYLSLGVPYCSAETQMWEPQIQWSETQTLSLGWMQQTLVALLATLQETRTSAPLVCMAEGIDASSVRSTLDRLAGVVLNYPVGWSDAYCFNLREAVLATGLVADPEQIFFVEDAIAALLAALPTASTPESSNLSTFLHRAEQAGAAWQGGVLVLNAGATTTDLLLVDLPQDGRSLSYADFRLSSIPYAGNFLDQDITCQMLLPSLQEPEALDLQNLELPLPGEPDLSTRYRLQQRLRSSALGLSLLEAARQVKLSLQNQASFKVNDPNRTFNQTISPEDVNARIVLPYLQRINREVNALLSQTGLVAESVRQVVCVGGTASLPAIAQWLRQKLPNAVIMHASDALPCTQVAAGLAMLPSAPHVLNAVRHQYSTFFLLREMLKLLPDQPLPLGRILQILENQGINTRACQRFILSVLEGQLPPGLIPSQTEAWLLAAASRQNSEYQALRTTPLFSKHDAQTYQLNAEVSDRLWHYLSAILETTVQTLDDPLPYTLPIAAR